MAYAATTFAYITRIRHLITTVAARRGVPELSVAGAIADEFDTRRGPRAVVDAAQDAIVGSLTEEEIATDRRFNINSKFLNAMRNDVGPANVNVQTAFDLVRDGWLSVPGSPRTAPRVTTIIASLQTDAGTVEAAGAVMAKGWSLLGTFLGAHPQDLREAVLVEYFKQGDSYATRALTALAVNPAHLVCPGDGGCRARHNRAALLAALHPPGAPAPARAPAAAPPPPGGR